MGRYLADNTQPIVCIRHFKQEGIFNLNFMTGTKNELSLDPLLECHVAYFHRIPHERMGHYLDFVIELGKLVLRLDHGGHLPDPVGVRPLGLVSLLPVGARVGLAGRVIPPETVGDILRPRGGLGRGLELLRELGVLLPEADVGPVPGLGVPPRLCDLGLEPGPFQLPRGEVLLEPSYPRLQLPDRRLEPRPLGLGPFDPLRHRSLVPLERRGHLAGRLQRLLGALDPPLEL
mmetsp:Transcript_25985/g.61734  ORF Transcript_25985/g.61734 Transcript_25985/m.61734 type:complete len:232 (+) Transcript_25985:316-1011(+)